MKLIALSTALLAVAQNAYALPVETEDASALDITLSRVSDTRIKAVVKNTGSEDVTFVHLNFFRDSAPVKKVDVLKDGTQTSNHSSFHIDYNIRCRGYLRRYQASVQN